MKRPIFIAVLTSFLFTFAVSCAGGRSTYGSVVVEPKSWNFGSMDFGLTANHEFVVTNKKTENINIVQRTFSNPNNDFQVISGGQVGQAIYAEGTHNIRVQFISQLPGGLKVCDIVFTWRDSGGKEGTFKITVQGNAVPMPRFNISPDSKDFGQVKNTTTAAQDFIVTNTGSGNLRVNPPILTGANVSEFAITAGNSGYASLPPAGSFTITVEFTPTSDGVKSATMTIGHDGTNVTSPFSVLLSGEGVTSSFVITPMIWDFGKVPVTVPKHKDFEMENTGATNVRVTRINYTGTFSGDFRTTTSLPITLTPGQKRNLRITFTPSRVGRRGLVNAEVVHDAGLPDNLTLDGIGANVGVLINELNRGGVDGLEYVELYNPTSDPADISGWDLEVYNYTRTPPGHFCGRFTFPPGTILQPGEGCVVYDNFSYPYATATMSFDAGFDITWGRVSRAQAILFFGDYQDGYGVDYFTASQEDTPPDLPSNLRWTGKFPVANHLSRYNIYRASAIDTNDQSDFDQRDESTDIGEKNPGQ